MDIGRNSPPVIFYGDATVFVQYDVDLICKSVRRFVDRIIDDLPQYMVETLLSRRTDIHTGAQPYRIQSFQNGDIARVVMFLFCHANLVNIKNPLELYHILR